MKKIVFFITAVLISGMIFTGCKQKNEVQLPSKFSVDIPSALTTSGTKSAVAVDAISGDDIYAQLATFIAVGDAGANIVESIINGIRQYNLSEEKEFSFVSDDDGKTKNVIIIANQDFDGQTWEYELTMTDAESEANEDGGIGLQIFWNTNPVKGIAIFKPSNIDKTNDDPWASGMFKIEYSEAGEYGYENSMIVSISDLPQTSPENVFYMKSLKMFVGKNGDVVNVFGNSDHPQATFYNMTPGLDWAFVAAGNLVSNLAVAEVGLPPNSLNTNDRETLLKDYAIKTVLTNAISSWYLDTYGQEIDSLTLASYLRNAEAPGFFNQNGFIAAGEPPISDYNSLVEAIQNLSPYKPLDIANMHITFKNDEANAK